MSSEPGELIIEDFLEEVSLQARFGKGEVADRGESIPCKGCALCRRQGTHLVEGSRFQRESLFLIHLLLF